MRPWRNDLSTMHYPSRDLVVGAVILTSTVTPASAARRHVGWRNAAVAAGIATAAAAAASGAYYFGYGLGGYGYGVPCLAADPSAFPRRQRNRPAPREPRPPRPVLGSGLAEWAGAHPDSCRRGVHRPSGRRLKERAISRRFFATSRRKRAAKRMPASPEF
jgi:hypothetical protein